MNEGSGGYSRRYRESLIGAISAGFFFILAGTILLSTPNVIDRITEFFRDFTTVPEVPNMTWMHLPIPANPAMHTAIYAAVAKFCLIWGIFTIAMLVLRIAAHSPLGKKADNAGDIVFWLGASYLTTTLLNETTTITNWFVFWTEIIMLIGVTLIVRAAILATGRLRI